MLYTACIIFVLVILIDILFYNPIYLNLYFDKSTAYIYLFSLPIIRIDEIKITNLLKNKINIEKMKENKEDIKLIKTISLHKLQIKVSRYNSNKYAYIIYPLLCMNNLNPNYSCFITKTDKIYIQVKVVLLNLLCEFIKVRRNKREKSSVK